MTLESIQVGSFTLDPVLVLLGLLGLAVLALLVLVVIVAVHMSRRRREARESDSQLAELKVRLQTLAEMSVSRHGELARAVNERLDRMTHRVGSDLTETARKTTDSIAKLHERLAVIDSAQKNLTELSSNMVSLQEILANKQARGAFGQARMEAIVQDGLPKGAFAFQHTLKSGKRPDCAVFLPDGRPLVIDAKFPLEAVTAFRDATTDDERSRAAQRLRQDIGRHVADIAEKYLVPGETQDTALMFVPSESVYAELHDGFDDIVQKAYRARVVLVSPALLMLAIQVIQQIQKDARMREAADRIRSEVGAMLDDLGRLRERVVRLERHFGQANEDIRQILISSEKIDKRATRIEELEFDGDETPGDPTVIPSPIPRKLQVGE